MNSLAIVGGRLIDPATSFDERANIRIEQGRIAAIGRKLEPLPGDEVIDVAGCVVTPGLVDLHVHLREPGGEAKETIATGARAAVAGGFTTVCAMPNTTPVIDSPDRVRAMIDAAHVAGLARVLPIAAASEGSRGETPTDAAALAAAGAVAVSDDGVPIATPGLLARVLESADRAGLIVAEHCEDLSRSAAGAVFAGPVADQCGVGGIPGEAESDAVARDLEVLAETGGRLHLCHLSTATSVSHLRTARETGLAVTAEVTPHHLTLTVDCIPARGTAAKMNPPLALQEDREALIAALADGTIDAIATDHAPHTAAEKARSLSEAPFGVVGLETAFGVLHTSLVETGRVDLPTLVDRMTRGPARAFGLEVGQLSVGAVADVAVFDLERDWVVDPEAFFSKSQNTPWAGDPMRGRAVATIVGGKLVHDER